MCELFAWEPYRVYLRPIRNKLQTTQREIESSLNKKSKPNSQLLVNSIDEILEPLNEVYKSLCYFDQKFPSVKLNLQLFFYFFQKRRLRFLQFTFCRSLAIGSRGCRTTMDFRSVSEPGRELLAGIIESILF